MRKYSGAARLTALALSFVLVTQPLAFAAPPASPAAANEEERAFDRLVQDFESTCALLEDALPEAVFPRAESDEELAALYKRLVDNLRAALAYSVGIRFSGGTGWLNVLPREERAAAVMQKMPPRMELILDASGSMNRRVRRNVHGRAPSRGRRRDRSRRADRTRPHDGGPPRRGGRQDRRPSVPFRQVRKRSTERYRFILFR